MATQSAQSTTDYKLFKILSGNRKTDPQHVNKLAKSMALFPDLFKARPILVNDDYEIIDGQHRYLAAKAMSIPVWYVVGGELKAADAIALNRNQRNWTVIDFIRSHANEGNMNYRSLLNYIAEFEGLNPTTIIRYLSGSSSKGQHTIVREGQFEIIDEPLGRRYLEQLQELVEILPELKKRPVAEALLRVFKSDSYDHDRMLKKMAQWGETQFDSYGTSGDILRSLENVYNFHQKEGGIARLY